MKELIVLYITSLIVCLVGFYKYVYFISIGYGFSIACIGVILPILFKENLHPIHIILCALLIIYGIRLGGYLLKREIKSGAYISAMKKEINDGSNMKMIAKISIWLSCGLLYVLQVSPILFVLQNNRVNLFTYLGALILFIGIIIESVADLQKSRAKRENCTRFCDKGLYKIVRCPNYFGEILIWTGVFASGIGSLNIAQYIVGAIGYLCIVYIMFGGARRLEIRQDRNYGELADYQSYVKSTPIIIPLIPLYSVKKHKWLIG